jgi:hypothetical protein
VQLMNEVALGCRPMFDLSAAGPGDGGCAMQLCQLTNECLGVISARMVAWFTVMVLRCVGAADSCGESVLAGQQVPPFLALLAGIRGVRCVCMTRITTCHPECLPYPLFTVHSGLADLILTNRCEVPLA